MSARHRGEQGAAAAEVLRGGSEGEGVSVGQAG